MSSSKWENLHSDILSEIIKKINNPCDHIRCSSICSSWRSVAKRHRRNLPLSKPGIMLSPRRSLYRNFIPLRHNSKFRHDVHHDLDISRFDTCCGSYKGWLVLVIQSLSFICLHNPFSKRRRLLPTLPTSDKKVYKAVLSSSPSFDMKCIVLILFQTKGAAFCRLTDDSWKNLECGDCCYSGFSDALFLGGRIYVVDDYGRIYACNVGDTVLEPIKPQPSSDFSKMVRYKFYLVEVQGQLYRILRKFSLDEDFYYNCDNMYTDYNDHVLSRVVTQEFRVSRMERATNGWVSVHNLGGYALFLGCSNSICLSELEVGGMIKRNKIYFTDDRQKNTKHFGFDYPGRDMGIYDMMDMSIEPLFTDPWYELMDDPPAVWVTPLPW
ncbi:putative F-box protein At5g55150 [Silene latifolia]|uniref:putative F-box protein At5g55150 n=1 Tax=Silene latifolia TaxID=37657 RepID=UPI003D7794BB